MMYMCYTPHIHTKKEWVCKRKNHDTKTGRLIGSAQLATNGGYRETITKIPEHPTNLKANVDPAMLKRLSKPATKKTRGVSTENICGGLDSLNPKNTANENASPLQSAPKMNGHWRENCLMPQCVLGRLLSRPTARSAANFARSLVITQITLNRSKLSGYVTNATPVNNLPWVWVVEFKRIKVTQ